MWCGEKLASVPLNEGWLSRKPKYSSKVPQSHLNQHTWVNVLSYFSWKALMCEKCATDDMSKHELLLTCYSSPLIRMGSDGAKTNSHTVIELGCRQCEFLRQEFFCFCLCNFTSFSGFVCVQSSQDWNKLNQAVCLQVLLHHFIVWFTNVNCVCQTLLLYQIQINKNRQMLCGLCWFLSSKVLDGSHIWWVINKFWAQSRRRWGF